MAKRIVDLTFAIHEGMTTFPVHWHVPVEITQLGRHGIENRETRKILMGTHTGTHCDAPRHFVPDGSTVDQIPLDVLIGPARVLDFSDAGDLQEIQAADLKDQIGPRRPERVVLRFDWSRHWGTRKYYKDHPFLSTAAVQYLVDQGVKLIAMDTPMPDNPAHGAYSEVDSPNHKTALGSGVILVEYLTNLDQLRSREIDLIVLPLKILGADGAPVRCVAMEDV